MGTGVALGGAIFGIGIGYALKYFLDRVSRVDERKAEALRSKEEVLGKKLQRLSTFSKDLREINFEDESEATLQSFVNFLTGRFHGDIAAIMLSDNRGSFVVTKQSGLTQYSRDTFRIAKDSPITKYLEHNLVAHCTEENGNLKLFQGISETMTEALMSAVIVDNQVEGVLWVGKTSKSAGGNYYDDTDLQLFGMLELPLGPIVSENARSSHQTYNFLKVLIALSNSVDKLCDFRAEQSERVALLASEVAEELGWNEHQRSRLRLAARLMNLGNINVPLYFFNKKEPLVQNELRAIQHHPESTRQLLSGLPGLEDVNKWALAHHERLDGSGYPRQLKGNEIPEASAILGICETYDALINDRPHREAVSSSKALSIIKRLSGKKFDSRIVNSFVHVVQAIDSGSRTLPSFHQAKISL